MNASTIVIVVVVIAVLAAVIALVVSRSGGRRTEAARSKAAEIREEATAHDRDLEERRAAAEEAHARSEMARAEARKHQVEADRLAEEADSRASTVDAMEGERAERLRRADAHDPDVRTDDLPPAVASRRGGLPQPLQQAPGV